eukprot:3623047-Rhodomonas_salina.1
MKDGRVRGGVAGGWQRVSRSDPYRSVAWLSPSPALLSLSSGLCDVGCVSCVCAWSALCGVR